MERTFIVTVKTRDVDFDETEPLKSVINKNSEEIKHILPQKIFTLNKVLFGIVLLAYLIVMLMALWEPKPTNLDLKDPNISLPFYFGLLMALFSFWISVCYSKWIMTKLLCLLSVIKKIHIRIKKDDENILIFIYEVGS